MIDERFILPEWVQAEKMERIVPLNELLSYQDPGIRDPFSKEKGGSIMKLFSHVNKKRKRIINCSSRAEMERMHSNFIERGISAEEIISSIPFSTTTIYKLVVEN